MTPRTCLLMLLALCLLPLGLRSQEVGKTDALFLDSRSLPVVRQNGGTTARVVPGELGLAATPSAQQSPPVPSLDALEWRHIGPSSFGGRIDDIEAVADNPSIIFVATASGGIFKTVNAGVTWAPVFDADGGSLSIGDVAIAPSDRNVVWAGTGEPNNRQSSSWGDGVYKSIDGGTAWHHMGLKDSHHVGRIVIHPPNPDIVYVAALGHLWGPNDERGLFKTVDGGKTWRKVLFVNADTGVVDVAIDSRRPHAVRGRVPAAATRVGLRRRRPERRPAPLARRRRDVGAARQRAAGRRRRPHRRRDREERSEHRLRRVPAQERRRVPLGGSRCAPGCA